MSLVVDAAAEAIRALDITREEAEAAVRAVYDD